MVDRFIVMEASAKMPANCRGEYRRVAVIETDGITMPKQINPRHRAVVRIVEAWERQYVGKTDRCAYRVALAEARDMAMQLNIATRPARHRDCVCG